MENDPMIGAMELLYKMEYGEIQIKKESGEYEGSVRTNLHPLFSLCMMAGAFAEMIYQAGHIENALKIKIDEESLRKFMQGFSEKVVRDVLGRECEGQ